MKCNLNNVKNGNAKIVGFESDCVAYYLKKQGFALNAKINILKNCKQYVAFYLDNCLCAIDGFWASKIVVEV